MGGVFTFSFELARNEQVVAFYLSNGRTRGVRLPRPQSNPLVTEEQ